MNGKLSKNKALKKETKATGVFGGVSAAGSVISAHNVCHAVCLAAVSVLSVFGVIVSSDVLMFLQDYNLLFWGMGMFFLAISLLLYVKYPGCMSKKLIAANVGMLLIGIPFAPLRQFAILFQAAGGAILGFSVLWYVNGKVGWIKWLEKM